MSAQTDEATYYRAYWSRRFNPKAFARRVRALHKNYAKHLPTARDIHEPTPPNMGITAGIVKHGSDHERTSTPGPSSDRLVQGGALAADRNETSRVR